ncbi:hypothetical protein KLP40_14340 [Hymenobacter sp. NST-14]|uniref:hypothetical protein n=1 Tax=Hymenobacter piscis TaxID=2839984 RepID=UPI001C029A6B|nr:hypothetical protein [Hymenobacter piscis]MBT9394346.1 hypothetical protein [Hymenobacter piscis]
MAPLSGYRTSYNTICYSLKKSDAPAGLPFASYLVLDSPPRPFVSMAGWQMEAEPGLWLDIFNNGPLPAQLDQLSGQLWIPTWPKEGWILEGIMQPEYLVRKPDEQAVPWASLATSWWGIIRANKDQYQQFIQLSAVPVPTSLSMLDLKLLTSRESRYGVYEHLNTGAYYISYVLPTEFFQEYLAGPYTIDELVKTGNRIFLRRTGIDTVLEMLEKKGPQNASSKKKVAEKV